MDKKIITMLSCFYIFSAGPKKTNIHRKQWKIYITLPSPELIKLFSCSTQLSTKFQLLIKTKYRPIKKCLAFSLSDVVFIMLLSVKMPTIVGIFTFMNKIKFVLS